MEASVVYYDPSNIGQKTCLVVKSRKRLHIIMIKSRGLIHLSKPESESKFMRPVDTSLKKAIPSFGGIAKRKGSTKEARAWLKKARELAS